MNAKNKKNTTGTWIKTRTLSSLNLNVYQFVIVEQGYLMKDRKRLLSTFELTNALYNIKGTDMLFNADDLIAYVDERISSFEDRQAKKILSFLYRNKV